MAEELGRLLSGLGEQVGQSFVGNAKARLMAAQQEYSMSQQDKEALKRQRAAEAVGKRYGAEAQTLYEGGESLASVAKVYRSPGGGGGSGRPGKYKDFDKFMVAKQMTMKIKAQQDAAMQKVAQAQQKGSLDELDAAMEEFNAIQESADNVKGFIASFTKEGKEAYADKLMGDLNAVMNGFTPTEAGLVNESVTKALEATDDLPSGLMNRLNDYKDEKLGIDLSGIPDDGSVNKFAMLEASKRSMPIQFAREVLNTTDAKILSQIAKATNSYNEPQRILAGARFKQLTAFKSLVPDGEKRLKEIESESVGELAKKAFKEPKTLAEKRLSQAVKPVYEAKKIRELGKSEKAIKMYGTNI